MTEILGWASSMILLITLVKQVYKQWQEGETEGISKWLFVGQLAASIGFTIYSFLTGNWVFVFTNAALTITVFLNTDRPRRNRYTQTSQFYLKYLLGRSYD
jgi:MtN3 and saliva related transmembrane protein